MAIDPEELRAKCRNAHPVDAAIIMQCADEIERLLGKIELLTADNASLAHRLCNAVDRTDKAENSCIAAHRELRALRETHYTADEIERLRAALETIAETGGEIERLQAAEALEETK
jgi:uncharacterized membrane protein